jgi:hypothetical protein
VYTGRYTFSLYPTGVSEFVKGDDIFPFSTHQTNFPKIEVHPRSLVAPDKVDRVLMSREKIALNGNMSSPFTNSETPVGYNENVYLPVYRKLIAFTDLKTLDTNNGLIMLVFRQSRKRY